METTHAYPLQRRPARPVLRPSTVDDHAAIEAVWGASQDADEPLGRPQQGWWSIVSWASAIRVLVQGRSVIAVAAIEYRAGAEAAEARLALAPALRRMPYAERLLAAVLQLAREAGAPLLRLYVPSAATWATAVASTSGFKTVRTQHLMLRPPAAPALEARWVAGVQVRPLLAGEESKLLAALNRAWADTWNARPLTPEALRQDLAGQRAGMLVAVEAGSGQIVATVHAMFSAESANPDGQPYAWISNLTVDPAWRGYGLGRAMLAAGLAYLRDRGAHSVALGVDGGATVPYALYQSTGFTPITTVVILERAMSAETTTVL